MSWDEIDFDLIVTGMITRGPAEASMSDILNQFARAGDERQNLIGENPTVAGITFEAGEIRNTIFWDKYRALINQYKDIIFAIDARGRASAYYTREVMTDPINFGLYAIDFPTILGNDLYSKIVSSGAFSNSELFTAEVINGFYTIYQNTEIIGNTDIINRPSSIQNRPVIVDNSGEYYEATPQTGAAGGTFTDLEPITWTQSTISTLESAYAYLFFSASTALSFGSWKWSTVGDFSASNPLGLIRNKNGLDIVLEMRDLDDNILQMDFVGYGRMAANEFDSDVYGVPSSAFNANHPFKQYSTNSVNVEWEIVTTNHDASGTTKTISVSGNTPINYKPMPDPSAGPTGKGSAQRLSIFIGSGRGHPIFIDLNNSALEFYIAP